jgi:sec-independent protein translocase protein TatA
MSNQKWKMKKGRIEMFGLQPTHVAIIVIIALLIFGPARLPEVGRAFGKTLGEFQDATKEVSRGIQEEVQKTAVNREESPHMPCKVCGKPIQAGMKFCPACGAAQQSA